MRNQYCISELVFWQLYVLCQAIVEGYVIVCNSIFVLAKVRFSFFQMDIETGQTINNFDQLSPFRFVSEKTVAKTLVEKSGFDICFVSEM